MNFSIVLACDSTYGIGNNNSDNILNSNNNTIPWNIPEDLKFFRELTSASIDTKMNAIIMGRTTADTLKKPLPNRFNAVITSRNTYRPGFVVFNSLDDAINDISKRNDIHKVFVIGGAILADIAIKHPRCRNIYLNTIENNYNCNVKLTDNFITYLSTSFIKQKESNIVICKKLQQSVIIDFNTYSYVNHEEINYLNLLNKIITEGDYRETRNAKTYSVFGEKLVFDLDNGFPLLTTKKMFYRGIFEELLFFLRGDTNTKLLEDKKVMIWHSNTTKEYMQQYNKELEEYDMGPMYGFLWRHYGVKYTGCKDNYQGQGIDQFKNVIDLIVKDPDSRRILMSTYDPTIADEGVLYPCHGLTIQFYVENNNKLNLQMYQR